MNFSFLRIEKKIIWINSLHRYCICFFFSIILFKLPIKINSNLEKNQTWLLKKKAFRYIINI